MKAGKNGETAAKSFDRLCECEKFMVAMMTVKQSKRKIRALLFKLQFRGCIHDLAHGEWVLYLIYTYSELSTFSSENHLSCTSFLKQMSSQSKKHATSYSARFVYVNFLA